jgi:hypothetical protein
VATIELVTFFRSIQAPAWERATKQQEYKIMLAIRQIIEDPQDVIAVPPEFRHRRTEVIFLALDPELTELECKPGVLKDQLGDKFFESFPDTELDL